MYYFASPMRNSEGKIKSVSKSNRLFTRKNNSVTPRAHAVCFVTVPTSVCKAVVRSIEL